MHYSPSNSDNLRLCDSTDDKGLKSDISDCESDHRISSDSDSVDDDDMEIEGN